MVRTPLLPAASMVLVVGASILSIIGSISYLGGAVGAAANGATRSASSAGPNFIENLEPLPSGSISAIMPLAAPADPPANTVAVVPETAAGTLSAPLSDATAIVATATPEAVATPVEPTGNRMIVTSGVNVRDRPSSKSNVLGTFRAGTSVAVLDTNRSWIRVSDGARTGWVYERFLRPSN